MIISKSLSWQLTAAAMACAAGDGGDVGRTGNWSGTMDTLPTGRIVVTNPARGMWDSASTWRLRETVRIGTIDGDGPDVFGEVAALHTDALGRIYVLEGQADEIRVFDRDGRFVRTIGRRGSGPGELANPIGLDWDGDGNLWVVDVRNARYSVFDTTGAYITQHQRAAGFYALPWPGGFGPGGRFLDIGLDPPGSPILIHYDANVAPVDTVRIPVFEAETFDIPQRVSFLVPFTPSLSWRLDARGFVWSAISGDYRLSQQSFDGDTVRVIERTYEYLPVTATDLKEASENLDWFRQEGGRTDMSRVPDVKPAIDGFQIDTQGFLWVRPVVPERQTKRVFDVFDPEGRYLGPIESPVPLESYPRPLITPDTIYGVTLDELEVQYVVRVEISGR